MSITLSDLKRLRRIYQNTIEQLDQLIREIEGREGVKSNSKKSWETQPISEAQIDYILDLCYKLDKTPPSNLSSFTKGEASKLIEELKKELNRG